MLQYLRIANLALMDEVSLEFEGGFTAVTGETGAGKSVLLGAFSLLAGNRAEKSIIRQGADACEVEATLYFEEGGPIARLLEALELPEMEEGALVLRRVIHREKPARIQVNGAATTLANLQAIGELWIDFHGPGEPQKLHQPRQQLAFLDAYAQLEDEVDEYGKSYRQWRETLEKIENLGNAEKLSEEEIAFFQKQIDKIDSLALTPESLEQLERDHKRLATAEDLLRLSGQISSGLSGEEGLSSQLGQLLRDAQELAGIEEDAAALAGRLESTIVELDDLAGEFVRLGETGDIDEGTARELSEKMDLWLEVKRRHGPELETVLKKRETLIERIAAQSDLGGQLETLHAEAEKLEALLREKAGELTQKRAAAAQGLARKVTDLLEKLGFQNATIQIRVAPESGLKEYGNSKCEFLFAANLGHDPLPLNKIASSGETARVMLALKTVLAEIDATPVLVFDEVDANVGGEIGAEVGRELGALAGKHQVFCVTHLPQVAAWGRQHYVVSKTQEGDETNVSIQSIHAEEEPRVEELARMLGDRASKSARKHAEELLKTVAVD
ncbi:MAG: DNA repair protein RecN [Opitutales bacterium]